MEASADAAHGASPGAASPALGGGTEGTGGYEAGGHASKQGSSLSGRGSAGRLPPGSAEQLGGRRSSLASASSGEGAVREGVVKGGMVREVVVGRTLILDAVAGEQQQQQQQPMAQQLAGSGSVTLPQPPSASVLPSAWRAATAEPPRSAWARVVGLEASSGSVGVGGDMLGLGRGWGQVSSNALFEDEAGGELGSEGGSGMGGGGGPGEGEGRGERPARQGSVNASGVAGWRGLREEGERSWELDASIERGF